MTLLFNIALLLLGLIGVVSLVAGARVFQTATRTGTWTSGSWFMMLAVVLPSAATAAGKLTGQRIVTADQFYNRVVFLTGRGAQVDRIASPILLTVAVLVILVRIRKAHPVNGAALGYALTLLLAALPSVHGSFTGGRITLLAVVICAAVAESGRCAVLGVAVGISLLMGISCIYGLLRSAVAFTCGGQPCGKASLLFSGISDNPNALGLLLAMGLPFLWISHPRLGPRVLVPFAWIVIVLTGSITSLVAGTAAATALMVCKPDQTGMPSRRIRGPALTAMAAMAAVVLVPFLPLPGGSLTGRPILWSLARERIGSALWIGHGPSDWRGLVDSGLIPRAAGYSTHNQFVEVLYVGGVVCLVVFAGVMIAIVTRAGSRRPALALLCLPILICAITERPWSLGAVDWLSWTIPAALLAVQGTDRSSRLSVRHPEAGNLRAASCQGFETHIPREDAL